MREYNTELVITTLRKVVDILDSNNIEYRFLGSVVIAAMNGRLHRKLGDFDLIIDINKKDILYRELTKLGYHQAFGIFSIGRKYLALETLAHPTLLETGYFYGTWQKDESFVMGGKRFSFTVEAKAVKKTKYKLHGIEFYGIPPGAIATGIISSKTNPKRKQEFIILQEKMVAPLPNKYIHIRIFGIKADWIYHLSMNTLNVLGNIRVKLGMAFDPWR